MWQRVAVALSPVVIWNFVGLPALAGLLGQTDSLMLAQTQPVPTQQAQCEANQDALAEAAVRELIEQVNQAVDQPVGDRPVEATGLTIMRAFRTVQALRDAGMRANFTEQLLSSSLEQPGLLTRVVTQAQAAGRADVIREVLASAQRLVQSLPSGYSAAKTRALAAIATLHQQMGQPDQAIATLGQAVQAASSIRGAEFQTVALTQIATGYIAAEQIQLALPLLNQSRQIADTINHPNPNRKAAALGAIATAYATAGNVESSLEIAQRIANAPYERDSALRRLSDYLVQTERRDRALEITEMIATPELRVLALVTIATGFAKAGQGQRADQIFATAAEQSLEAGGQSSSVLSTAVQQYAQSGRTETARAVAQTIADGGDRGQALVAIARYYQENDQPEEATATLTEAIAALQTIGDPIQQGGVVQSIVQDRVQRGHYAIALQMAQTLPSEAVGLSFGQDDLIWQTARAAAIAGDFEVALKAAEAIDPTAIDYINQAYQAIALSYAKAGQFESAMAMTEQISNTGAYAYQIRTLAAIAGAYTQAGQATAAEQTLAQALEQARRIESPAVKADGLAAIAIQYAKSGRIDRVSALQAEALGAAALLSDSSTNSQVLREIVEQYLNAEQYTAAVEAAEAMLDTGDRTNTLSGIVNRAIQTGAYEAALVATGTLDAPEMRTRFLVSLADRYLQTAQPTQAIQLLAQAFETAKTIPGAESKTIVLRTETDGQGNIISSLVVDDDNDRGSLLEAIALSYAQAGQYTQAVQVARSIQTATVRSALLQRLQCYQ